MCWVCLGLRLWPALLQQDMPGSESGRQVSLGYLQAGRSRNIGRQCSARVSGVRDQGLKQSGLGWAESMVIKTRWIEKRGGRWGSSMLCSPVPKRRVRWYQKEGRIKADMRPKFTVFLNFQIVNSFIWFNHTYYKLFNVFPFTSGAFFLLYHTDT